MVMFEDTLLERGRFSRLSRKIPKDSRHFVLARDGKRCFCCAHDQRLTIDHIVPKTFGSSNHTYNLLVLCEQCNRRKADMMPREWLELVRAKLDETHYERLLERVILAETYHIMVSEPMIKRTIMVHNADSDSLRPVVVQKPTTEASPTSKHSMLTVVFVAALLLAFIISFWVGFLHMIGKGAL